MIGHKAGMFKIKAVSSFAILFCFCFFSFFFYSIKQDIKIIIIQETVFGDENSPKPSNHAKSRCIIASEIKNCAVIETHLFISTFSLCSNARLYHFIVLH